MAPDAADLAELRAWRHARHRRPEVSGAESETAAAVVEALAPLCPEEIVTGLGGHGVAAVFTGQGAGPTVLLRAELDALPIPDGAGLAYSSEVPGRGHLCGHDGHLAILLGVARLLARDRPPRGRVVLLFQPAEEDGSGAAAVLADPRFALLRPDWAFALHNMPGLPLGAARISAGPANCASVGLRLRLEGRTAHAATPDTGLSPIPALLRLIPELQALGPGGALDEGFRLVTLTHARIGTPAFGIAPGEAELWLTLRCLTDGPMAELRRAVIDHVRAEARAHGLGIVESWHDDFAACRNDERATALFARAADRAGLSIGPAEPMRASEDFGRFGTGGTRSAMMLLGAGEDHPALHDPHYDFPDDLIAPGVALFLAVVAEALG